jgi:copper transport protein
MLSVFAIAITGIAQSASFLGSFEALLDTAYGRALLVKIGLFIVLVAFGAFHQQVIASRLQPWRRDPNMAATAGRRFRASVMAELAVSVLLFVAVGALTSLPLGRDVAVDPAAQDVLQSQSSAGLTMTLGVTPATAGLNQFDLRLGNQADVPVDNVEKVTLRYHSETMDMGEAEIILAPYGGGHYVAQSSGLSMLGAWRINAIVRRAGMPDTTASFALDLR